VTLRAPLSLGPALTLSGSASVRRTDWNISRDPESGAVLDVPISRNVVELRGRIVGPVFTRVFNTPGSGFAERYKHVIEPAVTIKRTSAFDRFTEVVQTDGVDAIIGGDTQVTYGITNRLLARVRQDDGTVRTPEILKLEINQTYYTKALAAAYDSQYQSSFGNLYAYATPESNFSPVRAVLDFTPSPTLGGQLFVEFDTEFRAVRSYRASFRIARSVMDFNADWSKRRVIPGLRYFDNPLLADHFLTLGTRVKRRSGAAALNYSMTYDVLRDSMLQQRLTGFYNAQCCGVAVDYAVTNQRQFGFRDDKRFSLSFTLAGVGSFTNLLGVFGNNGTQR
jgi:hypothetical protein